MAKPTRERDPYDTRAEDAAAVDQADAERQLRALEVTDFKWLMGHRQGRRFMWRLLSLTGLHPKPYPLSGPEGDVAFWWGEMNIRQRMGTEIHEIFPQRYNEMIREQQTRVKKQQAEHLRGA